MNTHFRRAFSIYKRDNVFTKHCSGTMSLSKSWSTISGWR